MQNRLQKIAKMGLLSAFAGTLLLANTWSAKGEIVTWKFQGKVTDVGEAHNHGLTDLGGTLPIGSPVQYSITFDSSTPGQQTGATWPEAIHPFIQGQFQMTINFGPYQVASANASSGEVRVDDDDTEFSAGNQLVVDTAGLVQTSGPSFSENNQAPYIISQLSLISVIDSSLVGTAIPNQPFPLSLATYKNITIDIETQSHSYTIMAEISASPCDLLDALEGRVANSGLANGTVNSLLAKLNSAARSLCDTNAANDSQAKGPLGAFLNDLNAQSGKKIPAALAASLAQDAQAILDLL